MGIYTTTHQIKLLGQATIRAVPLKQRKVKIVKRTPTRLPNSIPFKIEKALYCSG